MTTKIEIKTESYNWRRWSKPWIAHVTFTADGKANYNWGTWVGDEACAGLLVINANEGDIIARGQKDHRGNGTYIKFCQVRDGKPIELESKAAAYRLTQITTSDDCV